MTKLAKAELKDTSKQTEERRKRWENRINLMQKPLPTVSLYALMP